MRIVKIGDLRRLTQINVCADTCPWRKAATRTEERYMMIQKQRLDNSSKRKRDISLRIDNGDICTENIDAIYLGHRKPRLPYINCGRDYGVT